MNWLRTPNGGYVDPAEVVAVEALPATYAQPKRCDAILRNGKAIPIDDSAEETWLIVANTRRNK